jgi:hypothetical protein
MLMSTCVLLWQQVEPEVVSQPAGRALAGAARLVQVVLQEGQRQHMRRLPGCTNLFETLGKTVGSLLHCV